MDHKNKNFKFLFSTKTKDDDDIGRSLLELICVLAITGVLSLGGLSGYSKAMFNHRTTQTIDTFSQFLQKFAELKEKDLGNDFSITTGSDIVRYWLLDECQEFMVRDQFSSCKMPIGMLHLISSNEASYIKVFLSSPKECTAFMLAQWKHVIPEEWWQNFDGSMKLIGPEQVVFDTTNLVEDISISEITNACQDQCNAGDCEIDFNFIGL